MVNIVLLMDITKMGYQMASIEEMATLGMKKRWNEPTAPCKVVMNQISNRILSL